MRWLGPRSCPQSCTYGMEFVCPSVPHPCIQLVSQHAFSWVQGTPQGHRKGGSLEIIGLSADKCITAVGNDVGIQFLGSV